MEEITLYQLLDKYKNGRCSPEEWSRLKELLQQEWEQPVGTATSEVDWELIYRDILKEETPVVPMHRKRPYWKIAVSVAALLILVSGTYFWLQKKPAKEKNLALVPVNRQFTDKDPGGDKAVLTLADGKKLVLDTAKNGTLALQGNTMVINQDGVLSYNTEPKLGIKPESFLNTISTPRGGQYGLVLPDGTRVWLNASSSLQFPTDFTTRQRNVVMTGEAYFEVAHNPARPFIVKVNGMEVEVLGTHFNINAYSNEDLMRTTLLQGKVKIRNAGGVSFLLPGQQAQASTSAIKIIPADGADAIAWKNGYFSFQHSNLASVMRQLERWYDVDVSYEGKIPEKSITGQVSRSVKLSQVVRMIELTGNVQFLSEGKKIIVRSK
jgi:ferric-dicitrate binding protein FerR (iron transport regulator)